MVSLSAKPQRTRAVQPIMPPTVINKRFLKRNRLRTVTLFRNLKRFQIKGSRSRKTREPALGALGLMSVAGVWLSSLWQASTVAAAIPIKNKSTPPIP